MTILEIKTLPHLYLHAYLMKKAINFPLLFLPLCSSNYFAREFVGWEQNELLNTATTHPYNHEITGNVRQEKES